jgi:hypothetical protein
VTNLGRVERPIKKSEYTIKFASSQARKGWLDLVATKRNAMVDTWNYLTEHPELVSPRNYRLKGELAMVTRDGAVHHRWQHKPTVQGTARVWFYIEKDVVYLEDVHTAHPNKTK